MTRVQTHLLIPLGAGVVTAGMYLSMVLGPAAGLVPGYFAMTPVAATGFGLGPMPAAVAAALAAVVIFASAPADGLLSWFALTSALPVLAVVYLSMNRREGADGAVSWFPLGQLLGILTAFGIAFLVVASMIFTASPGALQGGEQDPFRQMTQHLGPEEMEALKRLVASSFPGLAAAGWVVMIASNCALAYLALRRWGTPLRTEARFHDIEAPLWPLGVLAAGALLSQAGETAALYGTNAMIIAGVPFFLVGLAVVHRVSVNWRARTLALVTMYIMIMLSLWPAVVVCCLGAAERWLRLRDRAAAAEASRGSQLWK